MKHEVFVAVHLVLKGSLIIGIDLLFLRDRLWVRLGTNIGIVVVFATVCLILLAEPVQIGCQG